MAASITVGTNSWVTIAESDTYMEERWQGSTWASISDDNKTQLLITAYRWINADDRFEIAASSTDDNVKYAQIETAFYIYNRYVQIEDRMALQSQGVQSFRLSEFSENFRNDMGSRLPDTAIGFLDGFLSYDGVTTLTRTLD